MGIEKIDIDQFLELSKDYPVFDVRSPGEYKHAHIPGACSLPLFTDEERSIVGTAYKQKSREVAIKIGLDFFGPKMKKIVEKVENIIDNGQWAIGKNVLSESGYSQLPIANCILLYCWRGGMRSAGVAWLLDLYGFKVYSLVGGYKNFRNYVIETFKLPFNFKILGGYTGSGKTELLKALQKKGEKIIDLEELANHKGSAFGNIGMPEQPGQEMFENLLSCELRALNYEQNSDVAGIPPSGGGAWLEDESQRIGRVNIPSGLWSVMRKSPVYFLHIPFEERLKHLEQEYGRLDKQSMINGIKRISEKLGGLNAKTAIQFLEEGKIAESFNILLKYYDKYYLKALHNRENINSLLTTINCETVTPENAGYLTGLSQYQHENH